VSKILVVDVGNTTTRIGLWEDGVAGEVSVFPTLEVGKALEFVSHSQVAGAGQREVAIALCSVVPEVEATWLAWAAGRGREVFAVHGDTAGPLANRYRARERLGGDRWAAAVGGVRRLGKPAVIASLGTATVVDAVSGAGEFLGGAIAVGVGSGLSALGAMTSSLPSIQPSDPSGPIGGDTEECLRVGAAYGTAGLVEGLAERLREVVGKGAPLALTGGHAHFISRYLSLPHEVFPALVLEGIGAIWEHNRGAG
jgi:type III pantothenate kinase